MSNQRKVTTNTLNKKDKRRKILEVLKEHSAGLTPKMISLYTGINVNTAKAQLRDIDNIIKGEVPGTYKLVDESIYGNIFDFNFQNAILSCEIPEYSGERIKETYSYGVVNYVFEIGAQSKKASLRISTDYPLNIGSICSCFAMFSVLVIKHTGFTPTEENTQISSMEFNKDFINVRLDGAKCLTIDSLLTLFKLYDKEQGVRVEYKIKFPISLSDIFSVLKNGLPYVDLYHEITQIKKCQELLIDSQRKLIGITQAILKKMEEK